MKIKETKENIDTTNTRVKRNLFKNLISDYRTDILQRCFGAEGGKTFIFTVIVVCLGRGLIGKFIFREQFLYSFFYPLIIVGSVSIIYIALKLISFKSHKVGQILSQILFIICCTILGLVVLILIILILNKLFYFWF